MGEGKWTLLESFQTFRQVALGAKIIDPLKTEIDI